MVVPIILIFLQAFQPRFVEETTLTQNRDTLIHQAWTLEDGLPVNTVNSIVQDHQGYIWFTTYDGIVRFDGINFRVYNTVNTPEMPQNRAVFMHRQKGVGIWITLENGGVLLIDRNYNFTHFDGEDGFTSANTSQMMEDDRGWMWFSTVKGLYTFNGNQFTRVINRESPEKNHITYAYQDNDGSIWAGTHDGLVHIQDGKQQVYNIDKGTPRNEIRRILRLDSGELLVTGLLGLFVMGEEGLYIPEKFQALKNISVPYLYQHNNIALISTDIGLYKYDKEELSLVKKHEMSNKYYWTFYKASTGALWMISTHGELLVYHQGKTMEVEDQGMLPDYYYNNLIEDRERNIWLATARNGLLRVKKSKVKKLGKSEGLSGNNILGLFEDSKGRYWVGTRDFGLNVIDGEKIIQYREADIQDRDIVHTINEDPYGNVWVGYYQGGVDRFAPNSSIETYNLGFGAGVNDVRSIFIAKDSTIWMGTYGGLVKFDPENENHVVYTEDDGLASNLVRYIDEDPSGELWVGTASGGVSYFDEGDFTNYSVEDGLASNNIRSVYVDQYDPETIWVGTENNGLSRIRDSGIKSVSTQDGLPNHVIHYINQDKYGWLWMSSNHGIFKINKQELNAYLDGKSEFFNLIHFGKQEGMRNPEANGAFQKGGLKTSENTFWFSTQEGVAIFEIQEDEANTVPPNVIIQHVSANGQSFRPDSIDIAAGTEAVSINFKALTFVSPEKTRYRYILEGYDEDWNEVIDQRYANYSNIPPGEYTFRVLAANSDGIWSEEGAAVTFSIPQVFYKQPWFYVLMIILLVSGYYSFSSIRYRYLMKQQEKLKNIIEEQTAQLRKEKDEIEEQSRIIKKQAAELEESNKTKDRFFSIIAHDLRNPFQAILGYSEMLLQDVEEADVKEIEAGLQHIHKSSKSLLTLVEHLLNWASLHTGKIQPNPERVNLKELIERTHQLFEHVAERKEISLTYTIEGDHYLQADLNMLQTILRNIVSNAIKFTPKQGEVNVNLRKKAPYYEIRVTDDGIGMNAAMRKKLLKLDANVSRSGTENEKGSGLGLLICKEMVELHNGELEINSKENEGTEFIIRLPVKGLLIKQEGSEVSI